MIIELSILIFSIFALFFIYFARLKSKTNGTFLFSDNFLNKADEVIFSFIKFVYKLYTLLLTNISGFLVHVPHKIIEAIHYISHAIAKYSSKWVERITHHKNSK
jgi:hypothetical protein